MRLLLSLLIVGVLAACGSSQPDSPKYDSNYWEEKEQKRIAREYPTKYGYTCENEIEFVLNYLGKERNTAILTVVEKDYVLARAYAASGARYVNPEGYEYWQKGQRASISLGDNRTYLCDEKPRGEY